PHRALRRGAGRLPAWPSRQPDAGAGASTVRAFAQPQYRGIRRRRLALSRIWRAALPRRGGLGAGLLILAAARGAGSHLRPPLRLALASLWGRFGSAKSITPTRCSAPTSPIQWEVKFMAPSPLLRGALAGAPQDEAKAVEGRGHLRMRGLS